METFLAEWTPPHPRSDFTLLSDVVVRCVTVFLRRYSVQGNVAGNRFVPKNKKNGNKVQPGGAT